MSMRAGGDGGATGVKLALKVQGSAVASEGGRGPLCLRGPQHDEEPERRGSMTDGRPSPPGVGAWRRWMLRARRRLRQWRGTEPRTRVQIRCEREERGGWWICPSVLRPGDIVYSFDLGGDLEVERALLDEHEARVYIFDPAPEVAARAEAEGLLQEFQLYAIRVGAENRPGSRDTGPEGARMVRLANLMRMLGHRRLDLLKLNVDDVAPAIRDLVELDADVRQLLVRFPAASGAGDRDRIEMLIGKLEAHGYRIFHIGLDGRRYSFIRTDFGEL